MKRLILLLAFVIGSSASADTQVICSYSYMGYPTAKITVSISDEGAPSPSALIDMQGKTHKESLTGVEKAPDELLHGWISKESPDNAIELIIYQQPKAQGQSVAINHNVPAGQEMWGTCTFAPASDQSLTVDPLSF